MAQIKQSLMQSWSLVSKLPAAKDVMPLFAQILNKVGFKVTGQGSQMTAPGQQQGGPQKPAPPVTLQGLPQQVTAMLKSHPNLSNAINMLSRYPDVVEPLTRMVTDNYHRYADWEQQLASGKMTVNDLKQKLVKNKYYNPLSYPRF
jgi:hypothetical protein